GQKQRVLGVPKTDERGSEERSSLQVEQCLCLFTNPLGELPFPFFRAPPGEVDAHQGNWFCLGDDLDRLLVDDGESRAKNFVPANELREAALERRYIELSPQPQCGRNIVKGAVADEPIEKPLPLLRE